MTKTIKCRVTGRVQGVWFRDSTRHQALRLGIDGSATNMPDGSVEILARGTQSQLDELKKWLQQGPELAIVENLDCQDSNDVINSGFVIA